MRYSKQREAVYVVLCGTKAHPDVAWIYAQTRKIIPNISLATVYRNLDELERLGKIKKVSLENFAERYDANVFEHAHLVCERCGRINDVEIADVTVSHNICGAKRYEITFYGICGECREKYNKEILK